MVLRKVYKQLTIDAVEPGHVELQEFNLVERLVEQLFVAIFSDMDSLR